MSAPSTSLWRDPQIRSAAIMNFLGVSSFAVSVPALPVWAVGHGAPEAAAGTIPTALLAATVATQLASPGLMRRFSVRSLLIWGAVLLGLPMPLYLWATTLPTLYAVSAVRGVGFALLTVVAVYAVQQAAPVGRQGEAIGVYGLSAALPTMIGAAVGAGLALSGRFWVVVVIGSAAVLGALAGGGIRPGRAAHERSDGVPLAAALRRLLVPLGVLFVATAAGGGVIVLTPLQLRTGATATLVLLVFGAATALARWRIGTLTDRRGHGGVIPVLAVSGALGLGLYGAGLVGGTLWPVLVGVVFAGVAYGALQSAALDQSFARLPAAQAPVASASWNAAFDAGTATGSAVYVALAATALGGAGSLWVAAATFAVAGAAAVLGPMVVRR